MATQNAHNTESGGSLDYLFKSIKEYRSSERFRKLMNFSARMAHLKPYNAMLVYTQKPGSRYVLSAEQWLERFNRLVKPNAQPLVVLNFKPCGFLFDLSDTYPDPQASNVKSEEQLLWELEHEYESSFNRPIDDNALSELHRNLPLNGMAEDANLNAGSSLYAQIQLLPSPVPYNFNINKSKNIEANYPLPYLISIKKNATDADLVSSICHELGHFFCGHLPLPNSWMKKKQRFDLFGESIEESTENTRSFLGQRIGLSKDVEEIEAECVAWLVCSRIGIKTKSDAYLAGYWEEEELPSDVNLDAIYSAANSVMKFFERMGVKEALLYKKDEEFKDYVQHITSKQ